MPHIQKLSDVVDWRLCIGCGACAFICPNQKVKLIDFFAEGIRPVVVDTDCGLCRECLDVCPAAQSDFRSPSLRSSSASINSFAKEWGPVIAIWEGHAADPEIRFKGSSGGVLTAIGTYCIEVLGMYGVLHIGKDPVDPIRNRTRLSRTRAQILSAAGSRYSPASVCNGLSLVEASPASCVVIGKPSEIAAVRNACKLRHELGRKVGLTLSFFCAGSPSTEGTVALLQKMGVEPRSVGELRYRGNGWPGHFAPVRRDEFEPYQKMTYRESWAFLQAYRPWSVQLWPDGTGELADISCGDPWYDEPDGKNHGFSLVVARTERGREIIEGAMASGYLKLRPAENWKLAKSQFGLLAKKKAILGRRLALRIMGLPITRLDGLSLWHCWRQLSFTDKFRSVMGTLRRILMRKLFRPLKLDPLNSVSVKPLMIMMKSDESEPTLAINKLLECRDDSMCDDWCETRPDDVRKGNHC
jgi:coenzyme F420 hydrogenase subunit beta